MMRSPAHRLLIGLVLLAAALPASARSYVTALEKDRPSGDRIVLTEKGEIWLEVSPLAGEGYSGLAGRVAGDTGKWRAIHRANGGRPRLEANRRYRVPFPLLDRAGRASVLKRLWPDDRFDGEVWIHKVSGEKRFGRSESWWLISAMFTGDGKNWRSVRRHNRMRGTRLHVGTVVEIPEGLLRDAFAVTEGAAARAAGGEPAPYRITGSYVNGELEYGQDDEGPYAIYRLGAGEALYSAVVVRFTGRIDAEEVNATADVVARRSRIADVTDIPIGYPVKIPLDLLTPEYLPPDHPRRIAYEKNVAEGRDFARALHRTRNLAGVTLILDAGHGGVDIGASNHSVWEDDYAYDILCRVKALLEKHTEASVVTTIRDRSQGYRPHQGTFSSHDRDEVILTTPEYQHKDASMTAVSVHLRWYLANYHYRLATGRGVAPDMVVFTSFHADSLHSSVRGSMLYVPGHDYRPTRYGKSGSVYTRYKEVRDQPSVRFTRKELVRSEGLSRAMAESLVSSLKRNDIRVHSHPVRNHVVRNRREWVPAVLRYNKVPTSLLVEVCNLNNRSDRAALRDPAFRQRFAEAYVEGLVHHFEKR
jgi:N-acetylmuramoyl-L-alanine amidase